MRTLKEPTGSRKKSNINDLLVDYTGAFKNRKSTSKLKLRLIKENILENKCVICGLGPEYNGKKLNLHLDHIDGNPFDNRLSNLRILCPNCHSQTETFCGKNKKSHLEKISGITPQVNKTYRTILGKYVLPKVQNYCKLCDKKISAESNHCKSCAGRINNEPKINWPSIEELQELLKKYNYVQLGKILGVSDNAIRKRIKSRGTKLPLSIAGNKPRNNRCNK